MGLDINKYCKPSKKRTFLQVLKIKWYKQQKQNIRKHKEIKFEEVKQDSSKEIEVVFFLVILGLCYLVKFLEPHKEFILGILWAILYCLGWLIGIIFTIFISKVSVCFIYRTSVSLAAKFVADVWEEVERKRKNKLTDSDNM